MVDEVSPRRCAIPRVSSRGAGVSNVSAGLKHSDIRELYDRYAPAVFRRARAIVGRDADAWDVVQEVFQHMLESGHAFRAEARPMTWVYRITTNLALNLVRGRAIREPGATAPSSTTEELGPSVDEQPAHEARDVLSTLAKGLTERELAVVAYTVIDGLTQDEIADLLGLSRKTINRELERIRERCAELGVSRLEHRR